MTIRIGVIGCGDIATRQHLPALAAHPKVTVAAVCDADEERKAYASRRWGVGRAYREYEELIADESIDAVVVATPPWVTPRVAISALRAGKWVLAEKPMGTSLADAEAVAEAEKTSRGRVQVGFTYRHGPLLEALRGWVTGGRLGSPLLIRLAVFDEAHNPEGDPEHYRRIFKTLEHGPPCVHDGAHSADHLHFLTGSRAVRVHAFGAKSRPEFPDANYNIAYIEFESGDVAKLEIGWFYPVFPQDDFEFQILGPKGIAWLDRRIPEAVLQTPGQNESIRLDRDFFSSCFRAQLEAFLASYESGSTPVPGTREAIASLKLTKAIEAAIASGVPVEVE